MKKARPTQIENLQAIKDEIPRIESSSEKTGKFIHAEQILNDIDLNSSFYKSFSMDLIRYKLQPVSKISDTLLSILDNAISYYKQNNAQ